MFTAWTRSIRFRIVSLTALAAIVLMAACSAVTTIGLNRYLTNRVEAQVTSSAHQIATLVSTLNPEQISENVLENVWQSNQRSSFIFSEGATPVIWSGLSSTQAATIAGQRAGLSSAHPVSSMPGYIAVAIPLSNASTSSGTGVHVCMSGSSTQSIDTVFVVVDTKTDEQMVRQATTVNIIATATALVALIAVSFLVVTIGLRPLTRMREQAERIVQGDERARMNADSADPSIEKLATTINSAFDAQQSSERRMREFIADASHELRTPVTIASGWLDLYTEGGLQDEHKLRSALERVSRQLRRMRVLIDELSTLARFDQRRALTISDVDVADLANEIVEDSRIIDPARDIRLNVSGDVSIQGDRDMLLQVLRNLVANALNHTPSTSAIRVSVQPFNISVTGDIARGPDTTSVIRTPTSTPGARQHNRTPQSHEHTTDGARIVVSDDGPGMSEEQVIHAFDRFWRADNSRSRTTGGSGLGLAIVASIVHAHHGFIHMVSGENRGTDVIIDLPERFDTSDSQA